MTSGHLEKNTGATIASSLSNYDDGERLKNKVVSICSLTAFFLIDSRLHLLGETKEKNLSD